MTEKELLKSLGMQIKKIRIEKGWSQVELGIEIDMEKSNVSRMESGKVNLKIGTLNKVAKAFDMSLADMIGLAISSTVTKK